MLRKGKKKLTQREANAIAAAKASGKTQVEIAEEFDRNPKWVSKINQHPQVGPLIARLKAKHAGELEELWARMVVGIGKDLTHKSPEVRIKTRDQVRKTILAGDAPVRLDIGESGGDFTLEELLITYRRVEARSA